MADTEDFTDKFLELSKQTIDQQAKTFLVCFVLEFLGKAEEILQTTEEFRKFLPPDQPDAGVVDEFQAHLFLEKRDETLTVKALRENMKQVRLANHHPVALVEYLLWKYKKTAADLLRPPKGVDPELLKLLDEAIAEFKAAMAARAEREAKMAKLEAIAANGGVKGLAAKSELEQMKSQDLLEQNRREVTSEARKRKAEKLVANDKSYEERLRKEKEAKMKEEEERLAIEKAKQAQAEQLKKAESRAKLAARAKLWQ